MGQKTHPRGFRLAVRKNWQSNWFAAKREFGDLLLEDVQIRKYLKVRHVAKVARDLRSEEWEIKLKLPFTQQDLVLLSERKDQKLMFLKKNFEKLQEKKFGSK